MTINIGNRYIIKRCNEKGDMNEFDVGNIFKATYDVFLIDTDVTLPKVSL